MLLGMVCMVRGQERHRRDTVPFGEWRNQIVRAPVLTGGSQPIIIVPNRGQFCFDKRLNLKMTVGGRMAEQCAYLDTHNGLTGILPSSRQGIPVTQIMPQLDNFSFTVMSMKGNIYSYKNARGRGDVIEHWVRTGNTQSFLYQSPTQSGAGAALARKSESRTYCDGKITAQAYKYDGGTTTWYVYGDRFPAQLHPQKFFGPFGVGYMYTTEGLYLVMELNFGSNYVRIGSMENVNNCFDPSAYQVMENVAVTKQQDELQHEQAKVAAEESRISGDCIPEKQAIVEYEKIVNQKHEERIRQMQHGNLYQDSVAQKAVLGMMDPLESVRSSILKAKLAMCNAQKDMLRYPQHAPQDGFRVGCLGNQVNLLQEAESRMVAIDQQYPTQPAKANAEKSRIYWELMKTIPNCE